MTNQTNTNAAVSTSAWREFLNAIAMTFQLKIEPMLDWWFSMDDIARYHRHVMASTSAPSLDDQTWRDLGLLEYLRLLSNETSIFGQQMLLHRLRAGAHEPIDASRIKSLHDIKLREALKATMKPLREVDTEIVALLFTRAFTPLPPWAHYVWLLPIFLIASFAGLFFSLYSLIGMLVTIGVIMTAQHVMHLRLKEWDSESQSLKRLLLVATNLGGHSSVLTTLLADRKTATSRIHRRISRLPALDYLPGAGDYADWFLLSNIRHYQKCLNVIADNRTFLQQCFEDVAALEADIAIATHLATRNDFCWATQSTDQIALHSTVHPLLDNAVPITIALNHKGILVTGQNGIGKSTLLKTIGINIVAGRAFGFCYAHEAVMTSANAMPLYASFNNEDSLDKGESLYMAELRRAKEMLDASEKTLRAICLIDEIFRGTNHIEAVAAASAVLHAICKRALVVVSSHHVVLAPLLANTLDPVYLEITDGDMATLTLQSGVLIKTNGVALLRARGFDRQIEADANAVLAWLNQYLAYPTTTPDLLQQ